jgi:hypothetical protein
MVRGRLKGNLRRFALLVFLVSVSMTVLANAGVPDYSLGAQELHRMNTDWIMPIGYSVIGIIYATAAVLAIYSATTIYIKLQTGDEGFLKSVMMLLGAILFLFSAVWVLPGFFGSGGSTPLW